MNNIIGPRKKLKILFGSQLNKSLYINATRNIVIASTISGPINIIVFKSIPSNKKLPPYQTRLYYYKILSVTGIIYYLLLQLGIVMGYI